MNNTNMDKEVREYIKAGELLNQKYNNIRFGKLSQYVDSVEKYKPIVEPLQKVVIDKSSLDIKDKPSLDIKDESEVEKFGGIAFTYLKNLYTGTKKVDKSFGIRVDNNNELYIGKDQIAIQDNDIFFNDGEKYTGTQGLWELLTLEKPKYYTDRDLDNYHEIVFRTCTYRRNNDPTSNAVKSSKSWKYLNIIKPMLRAVKSTSVEGSGLQKISINRPVEYVYWNTLEELLDRLCILHGEVKAGNTNPLLINEIANIIQEFKEI